MSLPEVQRHVSFRILLPSLPGLGAPDAVYLARLQGGMQRVSLAYGPRSGIPRAASTGVGLLLTEIRAGTDAGLLEKVAFQGTRVEPVTVDGEPGWWLHGRPHEVYYINEHGLIVPDTVRLAGNVLLWLHGNVTLRIESALEKREALRIARSVSPQGP
jgi:PAS domain-containing protein